MKRENGKEMGLGKFILVAAISGVPVYRSVFRHKRFMANPEKYTVEKTYDYAVYLCDSLRKNSGTTNIVQGLENLPKEGGYVVCPNHQGKYDAIAIFTTHKDPIAVLMEDKQSQKIVAKQTVDFTRGKRLDFDDPKAQLKVLDEIAAELSGGKKYLIFPEGGYADNKNTMRKFNAGCFRPVMKSKVPIVPVCLIDSYKALNGNKLGREKVKIFYLEPIPYEEYKDLKKNEIAELVKSRIQAKLDEELGNN